ncbi:acyl carrier protein [Paenibacillus athensensis]|uniref:Carrier domain-containing protein n=1 Tax=Paenibacillus athensensis TaxID=1967502 RepID=A0A4Y8Q913_9BACL|nr:acyl carrier protein [Paenibacillus athensensis]MCD1258895.1 acyl carrier protein [Paenibacillus athensensis]
MEQNTQITRLVQQIIKNENFAYRDNLEMYGLDSVHTIRIAVELETVFDITIPDDELLLNNFISIEKMDYLVRMCKQL